MRRRRGHTLRRRYGRSAGGFKPTSTSGTHVASSGSAHTTREPDGLYYTWNRGNWYLAFKSRKKALAHMRVLGGLS